MPTEEEHLEHMQNLEQELQALIDNRANYYNTMYGEDDDSPVDAFEDTYRIIADGLLFLSRSYVGIRRLEDAVKQILSEDPQDVPQDPQ